MRLTILALSAAAISGCSWLGGGHGQQMYITAGCSPAGGSYHQAGFQNPGYQYAGDQQQFGYAQGAGCVSGAYGAQPSMHAYGAGYSADVHGYQYGAGQSFAAQGYGGATQVAQNSFGHAAAGYPAGATSPGASAPYGAAAPTQYASAGQYGQTAAVQTVVGAPLYVGQPYPVPQMRGSACCGTQGYAGGYSGGGAMPFGFELFAGTEFEASGNIFTKQFVGPPDGDFTINARVGAINPISYDDAFGATKTIGAAISYDLSPNTTVLGSIAHGVAEGQTVTEYTTFQPGTWAGTTFTPAAGSTARHLDGSFTDLETTTLEAGLRHYVGKPHSLRPYVGATAGFVHNGDVQFTQTYTDDGSFFGEREFVESGWNPTASATLGAELALSPRAAIGVESGIRWRDDMNSTAPSEDRVSIPLTFRGRLSF